MVQESLITLSISRASDKFQFFVMQDGTLLINNQVLSSEESKEVREFTHQYSAMFEHGRRPQMGLADQLSIGKRLFDLWLASSWKNVKVPTGARRILVIASEIPEILNLPWEILVLPDGKHIGLNPNFSIRRLPKSDGSLPEFKGELKPMPLRLLYMACSPIDQAMLDYELEEESLLKAIGNLKVACDFGELGSFAELQERIADFQPHIVHLTGHGAVGKKCPNCSNLNSSNESKCRSCSASLEDVKPQGHFLFEDDSGQGDPRSSEELGQILAGSDVKCAFISGCQTSQAPAVEALGGICQGLVGQEVPLAVGWAASIADDLATKFAQIFYQNMASNQPIDRALYMARNGIWNDCKARSDPSWALPVLYSSTSQSLILDPKLPRSEPPRESKYLLRPIPGIEGYADHFVGRRREQQYILPKLRNGELQAVILMGLGGSGKSALATKIARKLEGEGFILIPISSSDNNPLNPLRIFKECTPKFREAAMRAEGLGDGGKARMIEKVAENLGNFVAEKSKTPPEILLQDVVSVLNSDKFLLILDNFESNLDDKSLKIRSDEISEFYKYLLSNLSGDSRAIITSRYLPSDLSSLPQTINEVTLGDFGQAAFIKSLRRDPKVEDRYRRGELDLKLFDALYSAFGGTPRFLGQIQDLLRTMNIQDLRHELEGIKLPSGEDKGKLRKAQEKYFETLFTSKLYGYFSPESQKALSKAAVFGIPVNLEALEAATGLNQDKLSGFARDWHGRAFAYPTSEGKELWAVYGLLRSWLLGQLSAEERAEAHKAAGDFLKNLVSQKREGELGLDWVDCLQEARAHYLQAGEFHRAREATDLISDFFVRQGLYDSVKSLNLEILSYQNHPSAMSWVGRSYLERGAYEEAREWYQNALDASEDNLLEAATALHSLGTIDLRQGGYDEARERFLKALEIEQQIGDRACEAATLHELASIDLDQGGYDDARETFLKALEIKQQIGNRANEAVTLHQLAMIDLYQGRYDEAREMLLKALEIKQQIGQRAGKAVTLHQLARIDLYQGRYDEAREMFLKALEIVQQIGDRRGEAVTWSSLGDLARKQGKQNEGIHLIALGYLIANSIGISETNDIWNLLSSTASELKFSQEQFDALIQEVTESYQKDGGKALLDAAFG